MRVLAVTHGLPPYHLAGAEWTMLELLLHLRQDGHSVCAVALPSPGIPTHPEGRYRTPEGLHVYHRLPPNAAPECDVVLSHLDTAGAAASLARQHHKPFARILHGPYQCGLQADDLTIANSEHLAIQASRHHRNITVLRPHTPASRYEQPASKGSSILLVNTSMAKGGPLHQRLATALPNQQFLAIHGTYDTQTIPLGQHQNLRCIPAQHDMRPIYAQARILVVPSLSESWGRVAVEAAWSGVPAVCSPAEGLVEAMGPAALYARPEVITDWVTAIRQLGTAGVWRYRSWLAGERAAELERVTLGDLRRVTAALAGLVRTA